MNEIQKDFFKNLANRIAKELLIINFKFVSEQDYRLIPVYGEFKLANDSPRMVIATDTTCEDNILYCYGQEYGQEIATIKISFRDIICAQAVYSCNNLDIEIEFENKKICLRKNDRNGYGIYGRQEFKGENLIDLIIEPLCVFRDYKALKDETKKELYEAEFDERELINNNL